MEVGIPQRLTTPAGTINFNDLSNGGFLQQQIIGTAAPVRNPLTNKPHSHGAIIHKFQRGPKIIVIQGLIVADTPERAAQLESELRAACESILTAGVFGVSANDGVYAWTPPGKGERYHNVHVFEPLTIEGPQGGAGGSPSGIAGPKMYTITLISEEAYARSVSSSATGVQGGVFVPNAGNAPSWATFKAYSGGAPFAILRGDGFGLFSWGTFGSHGSYITIDMFRQTMYWDGNGVNALGDLDFYTSDFFEIPPGGAVINSDCPATCFSQDGWVS